MKDKKQYLAPIIEIVELDNEISLQLESAAPPSGPDEGASLAPDYTKNDPFKNQNV